MSPESEARPRDGANRLGSSSPGSFVAVVGPSGAGKDSLITIAATGLRADTAFFFPRRVVTRTALPDAEDHDSLTPAAFVVAQAAGAFCLTWSAHGLSYGLPAAISGHLAAGHTVVANVSRGALREAAERFPRLHLVEVTAPHHLLVARIAGRGRETPEEIDRRLRRQARLDVPARTEGVHRVDNGRSLDEAAAAFLGILRQIRATR